MINPQYGGRKDPDESKMSWLSHYDPTGIIICLTLFGLSTVAFMIIPLFTVFHAGKWYPVIEVSFFIVINAILLVAMTAIYFFRAKKDVMVFMSNWKGQKEIKSYIGILKDHLKQDYVSTLVVGWIFWAIIGFWSLSYIVVHPHYKGLVYTPPETSNLYNSFLRLCGGQVFFCTVVLYFVIKTLTGIVNIDYMLGHVPTSAIDKYQDTVVRVFFWLSFVLVIGGFLYCILMYVSNLGSPTHFQMSGWMGLLIVLTGLYLIVACLYIFVIRRTVSLYHAVYCGFLTFWFGLILVNWFFYMDGLADNYTFGNDAPTWKNMPLSSYYYTFRVLTNLNSGYLVFVLSSFIPICFAHAGTVNVNAVEKFPGHWALDAWSVLTIVLCLIILGFSVGGMTNWYYLYVNYVSYAGGITGVLTLFVIVGIVLAGYAAWQLHSQGQKIYGEGQARYIQMVVSSLLVLILIVIEYWVMWDNYSAFGHKNTAPAKDINDRASTGWNDLQLSVFCITLALLSISIKIFSGMMVHSEKMKGVGGASTQMRQMT